MKKYTFLFISILFIGQLAAQVEQVEQGLLVNPLLQIEKNREMQKWNQFISSNYPSHVNLPETNRGENSDWICVYAGGEPESTCINPPTGPGSGTFSCLTCANVSNGSAGMEDNCLVFSPPLSGVPFGLDTVLVEFCDTLGSCDTFTYHFAISRPGQTLIEAPLELPAEAFAELEADTTLLPTPFKTGWGFGCNNPLLSHFYGILNKGFYQAKRFSGRDTACLLLFDSYCVTDTVRFPIVIHQDTLVLKSDLFFDDFSYSGNYPSGRLWLDKHVFRNNTLGYEPPSIGMATFDGVDETGTPYGTGYGVSDYLTSLYLDTRDINAKAYLSFWVQLKGYGLPPLNADSLVVEFRKQNGDWEKVLGLPGDVTLDIDALPPFEFYSLELTPEYQYNGFQFRFRNSSNNTGVTSMWHLDYVLLRDGFTQEPEAGFSDLAFVEPPGPILKTYSSMPWGHFAAQMETELLDTFRYSISNRFTISNSISGSGRIVLKEVAAGAPNLLPDGFTLADATNLNAGELLRGSRTLPGDIRDDLLQTFKDNYPEDGERDFITEYNFVSGASQAGIPEVLVNDTVRHTTRFRDYFAYDDGTAERNLVTFKKGMMIAVKYTTSQPDTLRALSLHLQHAFSNLSSQIMNLHVWIGDLDGEPAYSGEFLQPIYADAIFDTLQGFTTYPLVDRFGQEPEPLFIPAGDFYIGWEQNSANNPGITVGFDKNRPEGKAYGYIFNTVNWSPFTDYPETFFGSVMMRPVFSDTMPVATANQVESVSDPSTIRIYPNPTQGNLTIENERAATGTTILLYNMLGQVCLQTTGGSSLQIGHLPDGLYHLSILQENGALLHSEKILLDRSVSY